MNNKEQEIRNKVKAAFLCAVMTKKPMDEIQNDLSESLIKIFNQSPVDNWQQILKVMLDTHDEYLPLNPITHEDSELYMIMAKRIEKSLVATSVSDEEILEGEYRINEIGEKVYLRDEQHGKIADILRIAGNAQDRLFKRIGELEKENSDLKLKLKLNMSDEELDEFNSAERLNEKYEQSKKRQIQEDKPLK